MAKKLQHPYKLKPKDRIYLVFLTVLFILLIFALSYASCNRPAYAQELPLQDSVAVDSMATINIIETRAQLVKQLDKLEADKLKIIGILEYLDWLEKKNEKK